MLYKKKQIRAVDTVEFEESGVSHMIKKLTIVFTIIISLQLFPQRGTAVTSDTIRVVYGFDREFPPFSYEDAGGKPVGFEVEVVRAIFTGTNVSLVTRPLSWDSVPLELASGTINISTGMVPSQGRSKLYLFSSAPTFSLQIRLFTKVYKRVSSLAMLRGQMVAVDQGTYQQTVLEHFGGINVKAFSGRTDGLRELYFDAVAAYCGPMPNTYYYINKLNYGAITTVGTPLSSTNMHIAINRNRGDLQRLVNQGMTRILQNGEYERIYRKWFVRELTSEERTVLIRSAIQASVPSYVPYTGKGGGAALLTATGKVITACDMENADPALSLSAIRVAAALAVAQGEFELRAAVKTTPDGKIQKFTPEELQTMYELGRGTLIIGQNESGSFSENMVAQLLSDPVIRPILPPSSLDGGVTSTTVNALDEK